MNLVLIFGSQPLNGQVLPGLVPPLEPWKAAVMYHLMLRGQIEAAASFPDTKVRICFEPGLLPGSLEGDLQWEIQRGASWEERLASAFASAFKASPSKVLAVGHGPYAYSAQALARALKALEERDVVLGKGLVGLRRALPSIFSTPVAALGIKPALVEPSQSYASMAELERGSSAL